MVLATELNERRVLLPGEQELLQALLGELEFGHLIPPVEDAP